MRKQIVTIIALLVLITYGQSQTTLLEQEWATFHQHMQFKTDAKVEFRFSANLKGQRGSENSSMSIWFEAKDSDGNSLFAEYSAAEQMGEQDFETISIEGPMDENIYEIAFGGLVVGEGEFLFDDFKLEIGDGLRGFINYPLLNPSFDKPSNNNTIPDWFTSIDGTETNVNIKGYTLETIMEDNGNVLRIIGKNLKRDESFLLYPHEGYSPQIGSLVAMMENLKERVINIVKEMSQDQIDHLWDENANSIGALIFHLAAAEKYYQVMTFENRTFNKEEIAFWQAALDLDEQGRSKIKGHDVLYYLELYENVRAHTLEELHKRDDEWLLHTPPGSIMNNHYSWFHVMEHQAGHLGQIKMLKKRLPKKEEPIILEDQLKG
ncbi:MULTISPECIES: DinB family protein [Flavobacteriaceae]|uniref:DinB family protein n=1 Tax=Flavobacteriaceae TaxID=49546 RepID=UPI00234A5DAE|nr:DUF664 domain-containing protein [Muricauda sp. SP22]MDC6363638.1 DUF664 domain-containing protein [Muricauda sp. SP22]